MLCETKRGCPVEKDAKNTLVNIKTAAFRNYKTLQQVDAPRKMLLSELKRSGLNDDPHSLLLAESIFAKYRNRELEKQRFKKNGRS